MDFSIPQLSFILLGDFDRSDLDRYSLLNNGIIEDYNNEIIDYKINNQYTLLRSSSLSLEVYNSQIIFSPIGITYNETINIEKLKNLIKILKGDKIRAIGINLAYNVSFSDKKDYEIFLKNELFLKNNLIFNEYFNTSESFTSVSLTNIFSDYILNLDITNKGIDNVKYQFNYHLNEEMNKNVLSLLDKMDFIFDHTNDILSKMV
ncbi:hypothetical protein [Empedobacter tilapiae]|uniref:hypothetical protein n=1 Tax=Empedobacter tilapiae TaxID=2491114 RepID=UPI0028D83112|nr:hypothetical protein [Empedobacter tilapiae]